MADAIDDILGSSGGGPDEIDAILGGGGAPAARAPQRTESPSFRSSDAALGIDTGPLEDVPMKIPGIGTVGSHGAAQVQVPDIGTNMDAAYGGPLPARPLTELEGDPIAQMVATSAVLGPIGRVVAPVLKPVLGRLTTPVVAGAEGAAASKSMGGSAAEGGALGFLLGSLGTIARGATPAAAAARAEARLPKDITAGATKRAKNAVKFANERGEGGGIAQVADELPEVGKALKTQAKTNPGAAHETTAKAVDELTDANSADFAAIQRQHGGVPLQPIAERLAGLEERLNAQGKGVSADAVNRVRTDLLKRYGSGPEGLETAKLTAQQIRNIRNDMGTVADPARSIKPNTKREALAQVYGILNKEIEDVAAQTRGVKVDKLRARNRQISTLIPVRDALAERAEKLADREVPGLTTRLKEGAKNARARAGREIDYQLSRLPQIDVKGGKLPASVPASANQAKNREYAARVSAAMDSGMSLSAAVAAADGAD